MTKLRKILVVSVMSMTVLSMSVVVAPEAGAAAVAGDLIKMDGLSSVYYLAGDNKRYVFPNEATYFSWYSDFSGVVTIPQSELETYPLGANVTMRPGTKLVKIQTDPKVYAVEPDGNLLWVPSEAVALALYGTDWAARVVDVADAFFTNYTVTSEEVGETAYPAGSLVMFGEDTTVYYIDAAGTARPISDEAAFLANRFKWDDIIAATIDMPTEGTPVAAAEGDLTDTSSGAGGTANAGTGLTIALAGDTPASVNLPSCSTLVPFAVVNLTASNDGDVTVQNLVFTRYGVGAATDFDGGYLYVGDERLTTKRSINTSENTLTFTALNLNIPAGMTKAVTLKMNAKSCASSQQAVTGNHYFAIAGSSDVSTNGAVVSGSFPIAGNTMAYSGTYAAQVTITGQTSANTYKIGETDRVVAEFDINNSTSNEKVNIYRIRLKQNEAAADSAIGNVILELDGDIVKTDVSMVGKYLDFILDTPYELKKSKNISAVVRGDILDDIGKKFEFYLKNIADVDIRGTAYGDNYSATIINSFAASDTYEITIQGSEINVSFDGPSASDIKDDNDDLVMANFKAKSENLDVNVETLTVTLALGGTFTGGDDELDNMELVDDANNVAYSGSYTSTASSSSYSITYENVYLQQGVQYAFEIRGDVPDGADTSGTYAVSINFASGFTARFQDADETLVTTADLSATSLSGKTMTIAAPTFSLANVTTNSNTVVKDATDVLLFKGKVTANNVDDLKVSKLRFDATFGGALATFATDWNRLRLYKINSDSTETQLDDETSLSATNVSFTGFSLVVPKGASNGVYFVVRGDVKNSPSGTTTAVALNTTPGNHTIKDSDNNAATSGGISPTAAGTITVATEGTYAMTVDTELSGINNDKNVLAGSMPLIGRLKMTAAKEAAILEDLVIQNTGSSTNSGAAKLYLYDNAEMTGTPLGSADFAAGANPKALFEDVNIEIPVSGSTYLYIASMVKGIDYSDSPDSDKTATENTTVILTVPSSVGSYTTKVVGASTDNTLSASSGGPGSTGNTKTATVYGAIVSNYTSDFANATYVDGTAKDIFSFKVTAPSSSNIDPDGDALGIKLATTTFTVATSAGILSDIKIERVGGANGEKDAKFAAATDSFVNGSSQFTIDPRQSYASTDADLTVRPGDTAEYVIRATISGSGSSKSLQVTIEGIDTSTGYVHETGTLGVAGADTSIIRPRLTGISNVRGGTLSN